jgi:Ubiquitin-binding domain
MQPATTAAGIQAARDAFFDTRVGGRPEIWAAVRLVCELVERGDLRDAQAVLDAAGGTCPTGSLWGRRGGVYDAWGERYVVPAWCVGWPRGVGREDGVENEGEQQEEVVEEVDYDEDEEFWKDAGKGKERIVSSLSSSVVDDGLFKGNEIKVRVRLSHTAMDVIVKTGDQDSVGLLLRRVRIAGEVCCFRYL